jgi:hypothetical protein
MIEQELGSMPVRFPASGDGGTSLDIYQTFSDDDNPYPQQTDSPNVFYAQQFKTVTFDNTETGKAFLQETFPASPKTEYIYNLANAFIPTGTEIFVFPKKGNSKYLFTYYNSLGCTFPLYLMNQSQPNFDSTQNFQNPLNFLMPNGTKIAVIGNTILAHESLRFQVQISNDIQPGMSGTASAFGATGPAGLQSVTVQDPSKNGAFQNSIVWVSYGLYQASPNTPAVAAWIMESSGCQA